MKYRPEIIEAKQLKEGDILLLSTGYVAHSQEWLNRPAATVFAVKVTTIRRIGNYEFFAECSMVEWEVTFPVQLLFSDEDSVTRHRTD